MGSTTTLDTIMKNESIFKKCSEKSNFLSLVPSESSSQSALFSNVCARPQKRNVEILSVYFESVTSALTDFGFNLKSKNSQIHYSQCLMYITKEGSYFVIGGRTSLQMLR